MKRFFKSKIVGIAALAFGLAFLVGCGDDDDFSPVSGKQGADDVESPPRAGISAPAVRVSVLLAAITRPTTLLPQLKLTSRRKTIYLIRKSIMAK